MPFQSDSAAKLEELILEGELKFTELEWINTSQGGEWIYSHTCCIGMPKIFEQLQVRISNQKDFGLVATLSVHNEILHCKQDLELLVNLVGLSHVLLSKSRPDYDCSIANNTVLTCALLLWLTAKDLIKSMLCVDTTCRFTARRILADPWFTVSIPCHRWL